MKGKIIWGVVSLLTVLALLLAACAPVATEAPAEKAPAEKAPAAKEAAPAAKEVAPAVEQKAAPTAEAPRYGGQHVVAVYGTRPLGNTWDEASGAMFPSYATIGGSNEELLGGDWARGPAGTGEADWIYSNLFCYQYERGVLAESWEIPDDQTVIFQIRKGIRWALDPKSEASRLVGGRELTADDVVFNIKRILWESPCSTLYGTVGEASRPTEIYASDKYTVVLKVPRGMTGKIVENVGDELRIVPPEVIKKYGNYLDWRNVVGTGPFLVADFVPMSSITWVRNPDYWDKDPVGPGKGNQLPYLDGIKMLAITDVSTRLAAMRTGRIDQLGTVEPEYALQLIKSNPELQYRKILGSAGGRLIAMRLDKPQLPFKDINVRRALMMAIDHQKIADTYFGGDAVILNYLVHPLKEYLPAYTPLEQLPPAPDGFDNKKLYVGNQEERVAEAKKLLAEAGYPNGFTTNIIIHAEVGEALDTAQMAKEYWSKIGVDLELSVKGASIYNSMFLKMEYPELWAGYVNRTEPFTMWCERKGSSFNMSMIDDPYFEEMYQKVTAAYFDTPKKLALLKEYNLYIINKQNYLSFPGGYFYNIWQPWLKNFYGAFGVGLYNTWASYGKYVWIDQDLKESLRR